MQETFVAGLAAVAVLGAVAQWLGWRLRLPAILLLLIFGFLAGPEVAGLIDPDAKFGGLLLPVVALSVALLLFEGSLTLHLPELGGNLRVVGKLVTLGAAVTWIVTAAAAHYLLDLDPSLAVLIGAILTVTGPTVVLPLLRQVRPTGDVGPILKWEGILIDPIGAVLAVLVFEGITEGGGVGPVVLSIAKTILLGGGAGVLCAWLLVFLLGRFLIPDHLHSPVALALAVGSYALGNWFQHEAGLLTVTVMGTVLANQQRVDIRHILEFKENLRVLLISAVFILLAARVRLADLRGLDAGAYAFLAALILVVRPLSVYASTYGSRLSPKEKLFLCGMAPRGVVAAAVTAVFALRLDHLGYEGALRLVPVMFLVIFGTVAIYGLGAGPLAYRLGLAAPKLEGVLLVGANDLAQALGTALREAGFSVRLVDTNAGRIAKARMKGLPVHYGSVLSEQADEELELAGLGRIFAVTGNDEVNALSTLHVLHLFGRAELYHLAPSKGISQTLRARILFGKEWTYGRLHRRLETGATIKATPLTEQFGFAEWREEHGPHAVPLCSYDEAGRLTVRTIDAAFDPKPGDTLLALIGGKAPAPGRPEAGASAG